MENKSDKKHKNKSQKQISEKLNRKDDKNMKIHEKNKYLNEVVPDKIAKKNKVVKALNANMKAVEKSDK